MRSTAADDSSVSALAITAITSVVLMIPGSTILAKSLSTPTIKSKNIERSLPKEGAWHGRSATTLERNVIKVTTTEEWMRENLRS